MPNPDDETANLNALLDDVTELVRAWRLRGFAPADIVAALAASAITAQRGAGLGREDMIEVIDHELGRTVHVRPTVQA